MAYLSFGCRGRRERLGRCLTPGRPARICGPGLQQVVEECWAHRGLLGGVAGFGRVGCLMPTAAGAERGLAWPG